MKDYRVASFFSGAGGLDLGFEHAGFEVVWANEFDKKVTPTLSFNFPKTVIDERSISEISPTDVPDVDGIIGGPPCQSWSEAGAKRGLGDLRGQVFLDYIEIIKKMRPRFFLAENVSGMLSSTHSEALAFLIREMESLGYSFTYKLLNAGDYGVPQDRHRVIFVGYHKDIGKEFEFPGPTDTSRVLRDAIWDLRTNAKSVEYGRSNPPSKLRVENHEYLVGGHSSIYMSRNRVRSWHEKSFTIQAGARHAPMHPGAPKMVKVGIDEFAFAPGHENKYRRLSVREAARIQTFPDEFKFIYDNVADGYKMVGNAVAVSFSEVIAKQIMMDLKSSS